MLIYCLVSKGKTVYLEGYMYRSEKKSWIKHLDFTLLDIIMQQLALVLAYSWRFNAWDIDGVWLYSSSLYKRVALIVILIDVCVVFFTDSYSGILRRNKFGELRSTIIHCSVIFGILIVFLAATKQTFLYSRKTLFMYFILAIILEYIERVYLKRYIRWRKLKDIDKAQMIVVTESAKVKKCIDDIATDKYADFKVTGAVVVDRDLIGESIDGVPVVATADTFLDYVRKNVVDEVLIDGNTIASSEALASELVELGVTVHIALVHTGQMMPSKKIDSYGEYVVLTTSMHIASTRQLFFKRFMDIVGSIVGLILTGIAFIIFAPIIKHQSPGPVFYSQIRIGRNGRRFKFYKFRSMYPDADKRLSELMDKNEMQGLMFKMDDDPRIIPIGRFMRKYSIDELPQFFNVLKGDMSLVGTRPPTENEFEKYKYHHKARLAFRPGLTGMWQVSGRSDITDFEEIVRLDTQYISNWTPLLDIKILFKTIGVVLSGKGSK